MRKIFTLAGILIVSIFTVRGQDVGVQSITAPGNSCNAGAQSVTIVISNNGAGVVVGNIPVTYSLDGGVAVNETAPNTNLTPGATLTYTFTTPVTIPAGVASHSIQACTALGLDINNGNNCTTKANIFNYPAIDNNTLSPDQTICTGSVPSAIAGSAPTGGNNAYTYVWESSTTSAIAGFSTVVGATSSNYTPPALTQTTWFRRVVSSVTCTPSTSTAVKITVDQNITGNTISGSQTICTGSVPAALTGLAAAGGDGVAYAYQWESSTTSAVAGFSAVAGAVSQNYSPGALTQTTWFRRTVTSGVCAASTSSAIEVTVDQVIAGNTVTADQTICTGSAPVALSGGAPSGGNGSSYAYQWESSTTSAVAGFSTILGAASQNYPPPSLTQTTWFRRIVSSGVCVSSTSPAIQVTVHQNITSNTITADQTICTGSAPATLIGAAAAGGDGATYAYQWESSTTSGAAGFTSIAGAAGQNYSPGMLTQTTWFRRVVTSGVCAVSTSPAVQVTVNDVIASNTISANQIICSGTIPAALSGSLPSGGNGSYLYQWESSTTSAVAGFSNASGVNNTQNYSSGALTQTTWFRRVVTAGVCPSVTSPAIEITVEQNISGNTISSDQTICTGSVPAGLTGTVPAGGNGSYTYQWESSTTSAVAGFSSIAGATGQDYSPAALTQTTWFRRVVTSGVCASGTSIPVQITINPNVVSNTISADQIICAGSAPSGLAGSTPTGGTGVYSYQWESSTTSAGAGFAAAAGISNNQNYTPGSLSQTTWFRRVVASGACPSSISATLEITVTPGVASNTITADQTICTGSSPAMLSGSLPTGGTGVYTYQWESSTTSAVAGFGPAAGVAGTQDYTPGVLTQTTWFRRVVSSGACPSGTSSAVQVTVEQNLAGNTITGAQTICTGSVPSSLTGAVPTGGTGVYAYQWESSTTSAAAGFSIIAGASAQDYSSAALTQTTWFRRVVTSGVCAASTSAAVQITVEQNLTGNTVTAEQTICAGSAPATLSGGAPSGGSGSYTYLWESSVTSAVAGFGPATGTNSSASYSPAVLAQTTWFRRVITSGTCASSTSNTIQITVEQGIGANSVVSAQTICTGSTPSTLSGSIPTGGSGSYTYQWESSVTSAAAGFSAVAGAVSQDYAPGVLTQTTWYRRIVSSGACTASTSAAIQITVEQNLTGNTVTADQTICAGSAPAAFSGSAPAGGSGSYMYLWESSATSAAAGFGSAPGVNNTQNYTPGALSQTTWFRRTVSSGVCASVTSAVLQITVEPAVADNSISSDQTLCAGAVPSSLSGTVPSGGNGSYTYQWESSITSAIAGFTPIAGATGLNYSPGALSQTTWYRRVVSSGVCAANTSSALQITVNASISSNTITPDQSICAGSLPATLVGSAPSGGTGSYTYQWESSTTSAVAGFASIAGAIGQNYAPGTLTQTTWYRRVVTSGSCTPDISAPIQITVTPGVANNTVTADETICSGTAPASLAGSLPTGGTGVYTYQWESSTTSPVAGYANVPGATAQNYAPPALTQTTWYRRAVTSGTGSCSFSTSSPVQITVFGNVGSNTITSDQSICSGSAPSPLIGSSPSGGTGTYAYQWESSTTSATAGFSAIAGATGQNYVPGVLVQSIWYRRVVSSGPCPSDISVAVHITVTPGVADNAISADQVLCTGLVPAPLTGSLPTGGTGVYAYQWESSTTSAAAGYSPIAGATAQDYSPATLTQTTWFRRTVSSGTGSCSLNISAPLEITVNQPLASNTITADQTICTGTVPSTLIGSTPSGGDGNYTYQWESSTLSAVSGFSPVAGATAQNYAPGVLTQTTWFRRTVSAGPCAQSSSNTIEITVNPGVANNLIASDQSVCSGNIPSPLTGSLPAGGSGVYAYQWESSVTSASAGFSPIAGATGQDYSPAALSQTTWYRRVVTSGSGSCSSSTSFTVEITINTAVASNTITADQALCAGVVPATLIGSTPSGGTGAYTYQWESSTTSASAGFGPEAGATGQNYAPPALTQTTWYRRVVSSGSCPADISAVAEITITPGVSGNTISANQTICAGNIAATLTGSLPAGGTGTYTYQWESSSISGTVGFSAISGAASQDYSPGVLLQTIWYRRVVLSGSGSCSSSTSSPVQITVNSSVISNTIKADQVICEGSTPVTLTGSFPNGGVGAYTYQWESSILNDSSGFSPVGAGGSGQNYSPGALGQTTWYRRVITAATCGAGTSPSVKITVNATTVPGTVTGTATVCQSSNAGSVSLSGNNGNVLKWEFSSDNGTTWDSIANTTNVQNYFNIALTTLYRSVVKNGVCPPAESAPVTISVSSVPAGGTVIGSTTVCAGSNNGSLSLSGNVGSVARWELSRDGGLSWQTLFNNTTVLNYSSLTVTTQFRALVQSCNAVYSSVGTVDVDAAPSAGALTGASTVCSGFNNGQLVLAGYTGTISGWEFSPDGLTWSPVSFTSDTFSYSNVKQPVSYRVVVRSGVCPSAVSNAVTINVDPATEPGLVSSNAVVCSGANSGVLTLLDYTGNISRWETSPDGSAWSGLPNTTNIQAFNNLTATTFYRAVVKSGACPEAASAHARLTVDMQPVAGQITGTSAPLCSGDNSGVLEIESHSGDIVRWERSSDGGASWEIINNSSDVQPYNGLLRNTLFRTLVGSGVCPAVYTGVAALTVHSKPLAIFSSSDPNSKTIQFTNASVIKNDRITGFSWNFGDNSAPVSSENAVHTYERSGEYSVTLTVTSDKGCSDTVSHPVSVQFDEDEFLIANMVTMNDNGMNDVWYVENIEKAAFSEVHVFNRYGNEVFFASPYLNNWDCSFNGKKLPEGTYYYILKIRDAGGRERNYKGTIDLLK
jgi:gliding motility-associated-like protein